MGGQLGRPRKYSDPVDFDMMVDCYVAECELNKEPLTVTGLALYLGFADRQSLYDYGKREGFEAFACSVKRARQLVEHDYEKAMRNGEAPAGNIFGLKNMGWKDKQEYEVKPMSVIINGKDALL